MPRLFTIWTATALVLALGALPASAQDDSDAVVVPAVKNLRPKLSPDGRYFVDQNGTPIFWLGTTQWQLFREYKREDATTILQKTNGNGFAFAQVMLLGVGDGTKPNVYGEKPWASIAPLTPNEAYFRNVDAVLQIARENHVVISLTLFHQRWRKLITRENARDWARWLARRYKDVPNIVWSMTPEAKPEFIPVLRELAAGLREGDGGAHLITFKPDPAPYSSSFIHEEPWLDFDSMQTWKSVELIYPFVTKDYHLKPVKPVLMAEGAYEHGSEYGFDVTPLWVRRQAYYSYLAGAHHTYGHNDSWRVLPTWKQALDAPGAAQMGILREVFEARKEWWHLVPDQSILASGGKTDGTVLNLAARHKDGKWLMVYLGKKATFAIDRSKFTGGIQAGASWINPRTGESVPIGKVPNTGVQQFTTPEGWEDALLILESPSGRAPLKALSTNPNYFTDGTGKAIYLTGSHTWNNLQDWGTNGSIPPLDFTAYVKMLVEHNHNFTLLWATELPAFHGLPTTASSPPNFRVTPHPWQRTGPGTASDGERKFDLTRFNQAYFDRLRGRTQQLDAAGIYAGIYFFTGEWLNAFRFSGDGYPFTGSNNVNGIDDGGGTGSVTMTAPNPITAIQDAYVKKVIDTLNDLPNVLWIVSEEAPPDSTWWNQHLIALARSYEAGKPLQHPIGYGVHADNKDATILNSDADWIAPVARISPTVSRGSGHPPRKVNVNDSDHSYFGMWNDSPQTNRNYFWINFTNGNQTVFMDPYVVYYPREERNLCPSPVNGIGSGPDPRWNNVRETMGHIRGYADRMNLGGMTPQGKLSSTGHVLAGADSADPEFLIYAPSGGTFTVNLSNSDGRFAVEWMNAATGVKSAGADVSGGATRTFTPPFRGDAVLYLRGIASSRTRKS